MKRNIRILKVLYTISECVFAIENALHTPKTKSEGSADSLFGNEAIWPPMLGKSPFNSGCQPLSGFIKEIRCNAKDFIG